MLGDSLILHSTEATPQRKESGNGGGGGVEVVIPAFAGWGDFLK
jgi:hypothetical protein